MRFCLALVFSFGYAYAQLEVPPPQKGSVVVTGTALPIPLNEADRDVTELNLPASERPFFKSWFELLQLDSALDLMQRAPGSQADLSIRGATFGQTLVLLNGMRVNDAQSGHFNLDLPVPIEMISEIQVLQGSGSTLYGSDAIGGVVDVRTHPISDGQLRLLTGVGNFGFNQEHAVGSFGLSRFHEELAVARDFSTGFTQDRDYRDLTASSLSTLRSRLGTTSLLLAYSDRPFGANNFYGALKPQWERAKNWFASAQQDVGENTIVSFAYRKHTDLYVYLRDNPAYYTNRHADQGWQGNVRRRDRLKVRGVISYGVEGLADSIDSNNLGHHSRGRGSGYVFYDLRSVKRYSISAGIREEVYGSRKASSSPTLSGAAWLNTHLKLRASASRAFRVPTYTDLYYFSPTTLGNSNLRPETATNYEAGLDAHFTNHLRASATAFQRRSSNGIDYVRATALEKYQAINFDKLRFTGVEVAATYQARAEQQISIGFSALHGVSATQDIRLSQYTFNYPVHNGFVEWRGQAGKHVIARTRVGVVDRLGRTPYALWDASTVFGSGRFRPFLQLTNISNTVYQNTPPIAEPTRQCIGGIEMHLSR